MVLRVEFLVIMLCAVCGLVGVAALLAIPVAAAALFSSTLPKYLAVRVKAREVDRVGLWLSSLAFSALNALGTAAAVYGVGAVLRLLR